jgi:hypothetical protein
MEKKGANVQRAGYDLKCPICNGETFYHREAQLNTRVLSFLDLDWVNPRGDCYICENCRHILWFFGEDERLD